MLKLERPWTRQPPADTAAVNINGKFFAVGNAAENGYVRLLNRRLTKGATASVAVSGSELALASPSGITSAWYSNLIPNPGGITTSSLWCLAYCNAPSTSLKVALETVDLSTDSRPSMEIYFGDGTVNEIGARFVASGPITITYNSGITPVAGRVYSILAARSGTTFKLYVDDVECTTSPSGSTGEATPASNTLAVASRFYTANTSLNGGVLAFAASHKYLTRADIKSKWGLFAPRRIYIPTAAAAASGLPILSLPTYVTGSITATGARGRVTATAP